MPEGEEKQPWGAAAMGKGGVEPEDEDKKKTLWDMFMNYLQEKDKTEKGRLIETVHSS
jgi:hypothetical protein